MASCTTGVILRDDAGLRRGRNDDPVQLVLWRGTMIDPPRSAAARALGDRLRRVHPEAEVIPYAWHLVTHGPEDGLRRRSSRALPGPPARFGLLQDSREVEEAWSSMRRLLEALRATRAVLCTPPGFTPGTLGRRLEAFARRRRDEGIALVWQPEGLWTHAEAATLARQAGVTAILRGLEAGRAVAGFPADAWLHAEGTPRNSRLRGPSLTVLHKLCGELDHAPAVLFGGAHAHSNLRAFVAELD